MPGFTCPPQFIAPPPRCLKSGLKLQGHALRLSSAVSQEVFSVISASLRYLRTVKRSRLCIRDRDRHC
ncbi:hypothetical protein DY000_02055476 [Brassica cretica]|uniref:Uncharacterized protein n=1 Tax=Brassica cretica TaxID=69181 RepID=A0ABQ7AGL3_BRACR|nr:hypothetical protein DY000_02055476 [Brassica cretica]